MQVVRIGQHTISSKMNVEMGVPQGSILGPILFIIYVNDLMYTLKDCDSNITMYADDTILYSADENIYRACAANRKTLNTLYDWCDTNRLTINIAKTKHMIISREVIDDVNVPVLKLQDKELGYVSSYNYLGVLVDNKLSFDEFVNAKYNKVNFRIIQLIRLRKYITEEIAVTIYKQMIIPLLDYADFMVESASKTKIDKLEKLQEKALKCISNVCHGQINVAELYIRYNVQPLSLRYREHISCLMYRQSKLPGMLDHGRPTINLRSNAKIKFKKRKNRRKYQLYLKSPKVRGVKVWEMLPSGVQKATTKVKFKSLIKHICR